MQVDDRASSFTSANRFPAKLLSDASVADDQNRIRPVHLQLCPTNICNLNCSFCSCADRSRSDVLPFEEIRQILREFYILGTRAITYTGGGEPLTHPRINDVLDVARNLGIENGLVTNGLLLDRLTTNALTWIRVSFCDDRDLSSDFLAIVDRAVERTPRVDWAFSYVLTPKADFAKIRKILEFAADHRFTHVRMVDDLLNVEACMEMEALRVELHGCPGEALAIYQGRKSYVRGCSRCWISLLKPVIGADGRVWPCCGTQYAIDGLAHDFSDQMAMGTWREFRDRLIDQVYFDGSRCDRCYYEDYNNVLAIMKTSVVHRSFA